MTGKVKIVKSTVEGHCDTAIIKTLNNRTLRSFTAPYGMYAAAEDRAIDYIASMGWEIYRKSSN